MAKSKLTKDDHERKVSMRVLQVADALTGRTKKYKTYTEFFQALELPVAVRSAIEKGSRQFSVYHLLLLNQNDSVSLNWLIKGEGSMLESEKEKDLITNLLTRMQAIEKELGLPKLKNTDTILTPKKRGTQ